MTVLAILEGLAFFVVLPIIIGSIIVSLGMIVERNKHKIVDNVKEQIENLVCSIDADCPTGYICVRGKCVPENEFNRTLSEVT